MTYFLDTDVSTLAQLGRPGLPERAASTRAEGHEVAVSVVTRIEVLRGRFEAVLKAAEGSAVLRMHARLRESESFLASLRLLTFDPAAVDHFDQLRADKKFNKMDAGDRLHAAIALAHAATLVTRNTKDYANVPGLALDDWAA